MQPYCVSPSSCHSIAREQSRAHCADKSTSSQYYGEYGSATVAASQTNSVKTQKVTNWPSRSCLNPTRTTPPCYNITTLGNRLHAQHKGPNVTNPSVFITVSSLCTVLTSSLLLWRRHSTVRFIPTRYCHMPATFADIFLCSPCFSLSMM